MAISDEVSNHVEEVGGEVRVYCANCGDPEGGEVEFALPNGETRMEQRGPTGYALEGQLAALGWKRVGDQLVCGDPRCGAALTGVDPAPILAAMAQDEVMTPEQVAEMSPVASAEVTSADDLEDFEGFAQSNSVESGSEGE